MTQQPSQTGHVPAVSPERRPVDISRSRMVARFSDDLVSLPGGRLGIGADALLGLIPGVGDLASTGMSAVIMWDAINARVPISVLARMGWNIIFDALVGLVPFFGDAADVINRANRRNYRLLEKAVAAQPYAPPASAGYLLAAVALFVAPVVIALAIALFGVFLLIKLLTSAN